MTGGDITLTFSNILGFISTLVTFLINLLYLQFALASTSDYFNLYERIPEIDLSNSLEKPPIINIKGKIEFNNVSFYYPNDSRKKLILDGITMKLSIIFSS